MVSKSTLSCIIDPEYKIILNVLGIYLIYTINSEIAYSIGPWRHKKWISFIEKPKYDFNPEYRKEARKLLKEYKW